MDEFAAIPDPPPDGGSWTEWRVTQSRSGVQTIWFQRRESIERLCSQWKDRGPLLIEERTCWASRPVRVEEQGEAE